MGVRPVPPAPASIRGVIEPTEDLEETPEGDPSEPRPKAPPIESRFLFVDIAAMRAKQLRRGARVRLREEEGTWETHRALPHKAERVAMEEVRRGLVQYDVPPAK
jgi:DNA-directed RNA polymerase subunit K/omega